MFIFASSCSSVCWGTIGGESHDNLAYATLSFEGLRKRAGESTARKRRHRNKLQQFRWVAASNLNSKVRKNDLFLVVDDVPIPGTTKTEPVGALIPAIL
jgi:hypothetical protein